jgi:hypothetical protein
VAGKRLRIVAKAIREAVQGKDDNGAATGYASCWACALDRCDAIFDRTCACCRAKHAGIK